MVSKNFLEYLIRKEYKNSSFYFKSGKKGKMLLAGRLESCNCHQSGGFDPSIFCFSTYDQDKQNKIFLEKFKAGLEHNEPFMILDKSRYMIVTFIFKKDDLMINGKFMVNLTNGKIEYTKTFCVGCFNYSILSMLDHFDDQFKSNNKKRK